MNAQEWLQLMEKSYQVLKDIKNIDLGTALGGGFSGVVYLILHLAIPHLFGLDYLLIIILLGALLGSGISRLFFNERRAKLKDLYIQRKITEEKIKFLQASLELGLYPPTEAEKTAKAIIDQFLLGQEGIKISVPNPTKQIQGSAAEEE